MDIIQKAMKTLHNKDLTVLARPSQFEVAALAVYLLGGADRSIDTEDAAIKCHELAPSLFSWRKYKQQINLELVRVSLSDAKKTKNRALLTGSGRDGWRLTSSGLDWVRRTGKKLLRAPGQEIKHGVSKAGSIATVRQQRERVRILGSEAWTQWTTTGSLSDKQARSIFRIDEYTTTKMLDIKVARLRALFEEDKDIGPFLQRASHLL